MNRDEFWREFDKVRDDEKGKERLHRKYHGQFVNEEIKRTVLLVIGREAILNSEDYHFNDIPLRKWDAMSGYRAYPTHAFKPPQEVVNSMCRALGKKTVVVSPSDCVCIYKEAARQIKEEA